MQKVLTIVIGVIFLVVGIFMLIKGNDLAKKCTEEVEATVIDMKEEFSTDAEGVDYLYYPVIEYMAKENLITVKLDNGSSNPKYSIGDKLTILYNPNNTKEFIVKGDKSSNIFSIVFIGLGALVTCYGIVMLIKK